MPPYRHTLGSQAIKKTGKLKQDTLVHSASKSSTIKTV